MKRSLIFLLAVILILPSCAPKMIPVHVACPAHPRMEEVKVTSGTVAGDELTRVIDNFQKLWKYIHVIEKLGCTTK